MPRFCIEIIPFDVPERVNLDIPGNPGPLPSVAVRDLDVTTVSEMCDQFRKDAFVRNGKPDPRETPGPPNPPGPPVSTVVLPAGVPTRSKKRLE